MEQNQRTKALSSGNISTAIKEEKNANGEGNVHSFVQEIRALHVCGELILIRSTS